MSWSRRRFLRGAGGALVAAPLLPTLARRAGAAELPGALHDEFVALMKEGR